MTKDPICGMTVDEEKALNAVMLSVQWDQAKAATGERMCSLDSDPVLIRRNTTRMK